MSTRKLITIFVLLFSCLWGKTTASVLVADNVEAEHVLLIGPKAIGGGWKDNIVVLPGQFADTKSGDIIKVYTVSAKSFAQASCFPILRHPRPILWSVRYSSLKTRYLLASFCNTMSYKSFCLLSICKITDFVRWLLGIL